MPCSTRPVDTRARVNLRGVNLDNDKHLADALGITVDELNAAQEKAAAARLAQAVTDGRLTQEQADLVTASRPCSSTSRIKGCTRKQWPAR